MCVISYSYLYTEQPTANLFSRFEPMLSADDKNFSKIDDCRQNRLTFSGFFLPFSWGVLTVPVSKHCCFFNPYESLTAKSAFRHDRISFWIPSRTVPIKYRKFGSRSVTRTVPLLSRSLSHVRSGRRAANVRLHHRRRPDRNARQTVSVSSLHDGQGMVPNEIVGVSLSAQAAL